MTRKISDEFVPLDLPNDHAKTEILRDSAAHVYLRVILLRTFRRKLACTAPCARREDMFKNRTFILERQSARTRDALALHKILVRVDGVCDVIFFVKLKRVGRDMD